MPYTHYHAAYTHAAFLTEMTNNMDEVGQPASYILYVCESVRVCSIHIRLKYRSIFFFPNPQGLLSLYSGESLLLCPRSVQLRTCWLTWKCCVHFVSECVSQRVCVCVCLFNREVKASEGEQR